jgi:hypothetical protein
VPAGLYGRPFERLNRGGRRRHLLLECIAPVPRRQHKIRASPRIRPLRHPGPLRSPTTSNGQGDTRLRGK